MMIESDCIFCKIANGQMPANLVAESEHCVAFWDINPRQPIHLLIVPKSHHVNVTELVNASPEVLIDLVKLGTDLATTYSTGSFRLTFNTGAEAGQSVFHVHGHITSRTPKDQVG
jgi:histidine triad (HIT) family protein